MRCASPSDQRHTDTRSVDHRPPEPGDVSFLCGWTTSRWAPIQTPRPYLHPYVMGAKGLNRSGAGQVSRSALRFRCSDLRALHIGSTETPFLGARASREIRVVNKPASAMCRALRCSDTLKSASVGHALRRVAGVGHNLRRPGSAGAPRKALLAPVQGCDCRPRCA